MRIIFFILFFNFCEAQIPSNFIEKKDLINRINSKRIVNNLRPFRLHNGLSSYAKKICESLQQSESDTLLPNSIILYEQDSLNCDVFLNKNLDLLGIWSLPHKFKCEVIVIIFDKISKIPVWYDLVCPREK
jgi:hypothetical protein